MKNASNRKALILCTADPRINPRPSRALNALQALDFKVDLCGVDTPVGNTKEPQLRYPMNARKHDFRSHISRKTLFLASIITPVSLGKYRLLSRRFNCHNFEKIIQPIHNLILVENLQLLPLAFSIKGSARIIFDAREYYPAQFEERLTFRLFERPERIELCKKFLNKCDRILTVSQGLADAYKKSFSVKCDLILSAARYHSIQPKATDSRNIRMVHLGAANVNRNLENLITITKRLDKRFSLDFYLKAAPKTINKLRNTAGNCNRIHFRPPVPFENIVPTLHTYDISLCYFEPTTFNLQHCLPNKFFESIQARLMLAIGPSPDMAKMTRKHQCGVISNEFTTTSMCQSLSDVNAKQIDQYKAGSHMAAEELNETIEMDKFKDIVRSLF